MTEEMIQLEEKLKGQNNQFSMYGFLSVFMYVYKCTCGEVSDQHQTSDSVTVYLSYFFEVKTLLEAVT